ncbi:hypothetical protein KXD40_007881 [Peronospora effusa]|uniref:Phospholipid/glycerol acyltransferase domain-containing protein n=1 Tax=Peronospora effusa TaxID=542832 RepID=A0A3M6VEU6_9STRA|nr:hypothetical protein DD238_004227 [Peronospora effusa]UIZ23505.1 hypothetical protein KXD40_007881 [Peronospora effusa]
MTQSQEETIKAHGRVLTSSSLAFIVAVKACKKEKELELMEPMKHDTKVPFQFPPVEIYTEKENCSRSLEINWRTRKNGDEKVVKSHEEKKNELEIERIEKRRIENELNGHVEDNNERLMLFNEDKQEMDKREHGFVNVMESSWLLASMEQRGAETTSSSGWRKQQPSLLQQLMDVRLALMDFVFIARSGVEVNLLGRPPSSVDTHCRNLIDRIKETAAKQDGKELTRADCERIKCIFESLKSDMVMPAVRCLGWLLTKTWRLLFHGLHVDLESLHRVRRVLEASEGDVSVVFAPTHKSHLDYLILSYLCFAYGIPLPRIAAGNNLDLPLVGSFLRANGSFFIRRSFRNDHLYKEVLEQYVHELLHDGNPVEVFVEGGRSRHGRVCKPRLGFMSMFLNYVKGGPRSALNDDAVENDVSTKKTVLVVPISLDYDKVYEVDGYANQLLGKPKEKESLAVLFRSVRDMFFLRLGHSYVRFGEPVSLTETSSLQDSSELVAERMQTSGTITSTAIVSALLMWKRAYVTEQILETRTVWLVEELEKRGATVAHVENNNIAAHARSILKVHTKPNCVVDPQLQYPVRALELGFYRNHLLHIFLPEMAVIGALDAALRQRSKCKEDHLTQHKVDIWAVQQQAQKIWCFLRHICRHEAIDIQARFTRFLAEATACDVDASSDTVLIDVNRWNTGKLTNFVLSLNWSFMDSLWLTTQGLWCLLPTDEGDDVEHTDSDVVRRVQVLAKELFLRQQLFHAEALCSESIKQSLDFLVESGVVGFERSHDGKSRVMRLCSNSTDRVRDLNDLTHEINARRKPRSFLWREDELPRNLTREEALELMEGAQGSQSFYAKWMAPPAWTLTIDSQ